MKKSNKGVALLTAATLATGLTACTKEEAIQEYEKEKTEVVDTINENDKLNNEELFKKIQEGNATKEEIEAYMNNVATKDDINELKEIIEKYMATTEPTTTPAVTTNYTTALAGTTYKTTATSGTTESLKSITMRTHETRGPIPTYTTTTNTTTVYTTVVEEQPTENSYKINNEPSHDCNSGYYVTDRYTIQSVTPCQGEMGEYLYSLVAKLYGKYDENMAQKIRELNGLTSNFLPAKGYILLPGKAVYYRANSVLAAQTETELPMDEIKRLNGIEDETQSLGNTYILVKVLSNNEKIFETGKGTAYVCGPAAIIADKFFKCDKIYDDGFVTNALIKDLNGDAWLYSVRQDGSCHVNKLASNVQEIAVLENNPLIFMNEQTVINNVDFAEKCYVYNMPQNSTTFFAYEDYGNRDGLEKQEIIFNQKQLVK